MRIDAQLYRDLAPDDLDEWKRLVTKAHPPGEVRAGSDLRWADLDPETDYLIRLWDNGELRSCAWVTRRTVAVSGHATNVGGIRGVVTDPDCRRRGYGRAVMQRAHELMKSFEGDQFALLFSSEVAVPFYESLGWCALSGPVTCEQPAGRINYTATLPNAPVMALPLRASAGVPAGPVDVDGLPW